MSPKMKVSAVVLAVAVMVLAVFLALRAFNSPGDEEAGPMASATPGVTQGSGQQLDSVAGDVLPASEIPWDDIGEGWWMTSSQWINPGETMFLISPELVIYEYWTPTEELDGAMVRAWGGEGALVYRLDEEGWGESEGSYPGTMSRIDVRTGGETPLGGTVQLPRFSGAFADGAWVGSVPHDNGGPMEVYRADFTEVLRPCGGWNAIYDVAPGGLFAVCITDRSNGTAVFRVEGSAPYASEQIDSFLGLTWDYELSGWLDGETFILTSGRGQSDSTQFAYDMSTQTISDYLVSDHAGEPAAYAQAFYDAGYLVVETRSGAFEIFTMDGGAFVSDVPCVPEHVVGTVAAFSCGVGPGVAHVPSDGLYDLETGASLALELETVGPASFWPYAG